MVIDVFVINLENRFDRREHILNVFENYKDKFNVNIIKAVTDVDGAQGLFKSYQKAIRLAKEKNLEYVVVCEDDHNFKEEFNFELFFASILQARFFNADILLGGPSFIQDCFFCNEFLLWVNFFTGLQFSVVYAKFYEKILNFTLLDGGVFDMALGGLSENIFCIYPTISYQKNFGYSDVTEKNNNVSVEKYFKDCEMKIDSVYRVSKFYDII